MIATEYPNCTCSPTGCRMPGGCETCGFDKAEMRRRKKLPPVLDNETGKYRKFTGIGRRRTETGGTEKEVKKKQHRRKQLAIYQRMEVPPDYSALMQDPESETATEIGWRAKGMTIGSIISQLASMKENAESFLHTPQEDTDDIWLEDIEACEAATAILAVLQGEGIMDAEATKDMIFDYQLANKQLKTMTAKYEQPTESKKRCGNETCPECSAIIHKSWWKHCPDCGKRIRR